MKKRKNKHKKNQKKNHWLRQDPEFRDDLIANYPHHPSFAAEFSTVSGCLRIELSWGMFHEVELFLATAEAAGAAIVLLVTDRRVSQRRAWQSPCFPGNRSIWRWYLRHHYQQKVQHMPRVTGSRFRVGMSQCRQCFQCSRHCLQWSDNVPAQFKYIPVLRSDILFARLVTCCDRRAV